MSQSYTATSTYTQADIAAVMLNVTTDFIMIATSTRGATKERAQEWAHDVELLAKYGYLKAVDLTLLSNGQPVKAVRYDVVNEAGELVSSRPGGVLWPAVSDPHIQIVLIYTADYTETAKANLAPKLNISWVPTSADISHSSLTASASRDYTSNGYGMQRKDYS